MDFPNIHSCLQLSSENEQLTKKVHRLKQEKKDILKKLKEFEEKSRVACLLRDYVTSRDVYVQTEPWRSTTSSGYGPVKKTEEKAVASAELEKTNKLLSMHSQLMKRYEKEVKSNITHVETISSLNFRILELERSCKDKEEEIGQLKQVKAAQDKVKGSRSLCGCQHDKKPKEETKDELKKLKKQCEKYALQNQKLKSELKGLDLGFFEEVEDIKFALRQSAKLNREYEKALRRVCAQFAVPYPNPEKILDVT